MLTSGNKRKTLKESKLTEQIFKMYSDYFAFHISKRKTHKSNILAIFMKKKQQNFLILEQFETSPTNMRDKPVL